MNQMSKRELALPAAEPEDKTVFGFWVYIMTDCLLFASLFATFAVLRFSYSDGPSGAEIFSLPFVLAETLLLLSSSFTMGLALLANRAKLKNQVLLWLGVTFILGAMFLGLELHEFSHLAHEGNSWRRSGFLSAFFTLVGTHGAHITSDLIWMLVMASRIWHQGLNGVGTKRLTMLALFWHFLDIIWIFIFTFVYLLGVTG